MSAATADRRASLCTRATAAADTLNYLALVAQANKDGALARKLTSRASAVQAIARELATVDREIAELEDALAILGEMLEE